MIASSRMDPYNTGMTSDDRRTKLSSAPAIETPPPHAITAVAGGFVPLRTLILVRWVAVTGQLAAVLIARFTVGLEFDLDAVLATIGASALLNLMLTLWPPARRLGESGIAGMLAWDVLQLVTLLYFTGGLANPFALLLLAPVTISATVLAPGFTAGLCFLTVVMSTLLASLYRPLTIAGLALQAPSLLVAGTWAAIAIGTIFFALYAGWVTAETRRMSRALAAAQSALEREHRLAAVGALAAATAHELGTPLGTVALVAREIARELTADDPLVDDVALLEREIARCRDILKELSARATPGSSGPFSDLAADAMIETIAQRYRRPGVAVVIAAEGATPRLVRSPEILHGLGNIVQNAIQFARYRVDVTILVDDDGLAIAVADDGPGFPPALLHLLGEPYLSSRAEDGTHMGLGIFIATHLLESTGARLSFANHAEGGAIVRVVWPSDRIPGGGKQDR
jgi:two-component system sensor histidine kinase RegB